MTPDDWKHIRSSIVASWPSLSRVLGNGEQEREWRESIAIGDFNVVHAAIKSLREQLAGKDDRTSITPVLGAIEKAIRAESRRRNVERRAARAEPAPDADWETVRIAEAKDCAMRYPDFDLGRRIAEIRTQGPFERRFLELQEARDAGADPRSFDDWWKATFAKRDRRGGAPESLRDLIGAPETAKPVSTPPLVEPPEAPEKRAREWAAELTDRMFAREQIDWTHVPANVRDLTRRMVAERKAQSLAEVEA